MEPQRFSAASNRILSRRRGRRLERELSKLGPIYTVLGYDGDERVFKETIPARTRNAAIKSALVLMREHTFTKRTVTIEVIRVSARAVAKAALPDSRRRHGYWFLV